MIDPLFTKLIAIGLGLVLAAAAWHKGASFERFVVILRDYDLLPPFLTRPVAGGVVFMEAALAIGWFTGFMNSWVATITAGMLSIYAAAISVNLLRGRVHISCGCGFGEISEEDQLLSWSLVLRNVVLAGIALLPLLPPAPRPLHPIDWATLATAAIAGVLLHFGTVQLLKNNAAIEKWRNPGD